VPKGTKETKESDFPIAVSLARQRETLESVPIDSYIYGSIPNSLFHRSILAAKPITTE
jgi:peptidoglycan hydrolase-like amidase